MGKRKRGRARSPAASALAPAAVTAGDSSVRWPWRAPLLVFLGTLVLYVATLAPSMMGGDSGELTASALTGGVPHPPGYPLFAILARLFAALPLGHSPAWRVNLLSATSTAATAALVCATVQLWTRAVAAGLVAAALLVTNAVVWRHATSAEVFGLNACFVALAFLLWLSVERAEAAGGAAIRGRVFALLFACGLAMCNHHTFVFVGAPLALRALWVARGPLGVRGVLAAVALGGLGLAPYAYLWFAAHSPAAISWGDQTTLDGFLAHVLRRNYGTFSMGRATKGGAFVQGGVFGGTLWQMLGHSFPRFLWLGSPARRPGPLRRLPGQAPNAVRCYVLAAVLAGYVLAFSALSNLSTDRELYVTVLSRFCIQSDVMLAIAAGLGFAALLSWSRRRFAFVERRARWAPLFALLLFAAGVAAHGREANHRSNRIFADFVTTAFASLPPNAIVITMGDHLTGSVFYFREVEKLRPDVIHLDRELLGFPWYGQRKRKLHPDLHLPDGVLRPAGLEDQAACSTAIPGRPLVVIDRLETWDESWKEGYKLATNGLVHPLVPASDFPTFEQWLIRDRQALGNYDVLPAAARARRLLGARLGPARPHHPGRRARIWRCVYSTETGHALPPARTSIALLEDVLAKTGGDEALGIRAMPGLRRLAVGAAVYKDLGIGYEILSQGGALVPAARSPSRSRDSSSEPRPPTRTSRPRDATSSSTARAADALACWAARATCTAPPPPDRVTSCTASPAPSRSCCCSARPARWRRRR